MGLDAKKPDPITVLRSIANTNSWNPEDIAALSELSIIEYYALFKGSKGQDLRKLIKACIQFGQFGNASSQMQEISKRAKEALSLIANESLLNARRLKPYGIEVESKPGGTSSDTS